MLLGWVIGILLFGLPSIQATDKKKPDTSEYFNVHKMLRMRMENLRLIAVSSRKTPVACPNKNFVEITEFQYGRSGNNLIEFTHGLWVAEQLNATLVVPGWMSPILEPFDTIVLSSAFCYRLEALSDSERSTSTVHDVEAEYSFFLFELTSNREEYRSLLPALDNPATVDAISLHFIRVYAALWSRPNPKIVAAAIWLITNKLDGNFRYTSVHKRNMEGGCSEVMSEVTQLATDFSPQELPMDAAAWGGNLKKEHPLCLMPIDFVMETQEMHKRLGSKLFAAFDGAGEVDSYKGQGAVFASAINEAPPEESIFISTSDSKIDFRDVDLKFLDMFIAMHGDFFIQNPRSTYSWEVFVIRVCLAMESVPIVRNNDFFLQKMPDALKNQDRIKWVSWTSVVRAFGLHITD